MIFVYSDIYNKDYINKLIDSLSLTKQKIFFCYYNPINLPSILKQNNVISYQSSDIYNIRNLPIYYFMYNKDAGDNLIYINATNNPEIDLDKLIKNVGFIFDKVNYNDKELYYPCAFNLHRDIISLLGGFSIFECIDFKNKEYRILDDLELNLESIKNKENKEYKVVFKSDISDLIYFMNWFLLLDLKLLFENKTYDKSIFDCKKQLESFNQVIYVKENIFSLKPYYINSKNDIDISSLIPIYINSVTYNKNRNALKFSLYLKVLNLDEAFKFKNDEDIFVKSTKKSMLSLYYYHIFKNKEFEYCLNCLK